MAAADIPAGCSRTRTGHPEQLEDGVRGFLIDAHYGAPVGDRVKTLIENEESAPCKYEAALGKEGVEAAMRIRDRLVGEKEGERDVYMGHGFCELGDMRLVGAGGDARLSRREPGRGPDHRVRTRGSRRRMSRVLREERAHRLRLPGRRPPAVADAARDGRTRPARPGVGGEQRGRRPLVPRDARRDTGDSLLVQGSVGVFECPESRRHERLAASHEPLDPVGSDAEAEQRGDRQRLRCPDGAGPRLRTRARPATESPGRGLLWRGRSDPGGTGTERAAPASRKGGAPDECGGHLVH